MILETTRLRIRELTEEDFLPLCMILQDEEVMYAYEHAFDDDEAKQWLERQLKRYQTDGFGLWAVILKETGELIGQCGLTIQDCEGRQVVEVGYLFRKDFWKMGYASEAATACRDYAFGVLDVEEVFSIIRDTNEASVKVALRNGMEKRGTLLKHYYGMDMPHEIYSVKRIDK